MTKTRIGDIVEIEFDDHAEGGELIAFRVWGRVAARSAKAITIHCWDYANETGDSDEGNVHAYTLSRRSIRGIRKLKEA